MLPIHYGDALSIIAASDLPNLRDNHPDDYTVGYGPFPPRY